MIGRGCCTRTAATEEKGVEEAESLVQKGGENLMLIVEE